MATATQKKKLHKVVHEHKQPRSSQTWEVELRPWVERV